MKRHFVSYHYPCPDGIFAALAARQHFDEAGIQRVHYLPNKVFAPISLKDLTLTADDTLYMLDYIGPSGFAVEACNHAGRVTLLDHHKTAFEEMESKTDPPKNLEVNLDMQLSGATIALKYFKPKVNDRQLSLFKYIEDGDLWKWQLKDSKFFYAGFAALGLDLDVNKNESIFDQLLDLDPEEVIAKGKVAQAEIDRKISEALAGACVANLGGKQKDFGKCLAVLAGETDLSKIRSQLGNALAAKSGEQGLRSIGLIAYREPEMAEDKVKCSLRSIGAEDTTTISKTYSGGGHLNASSFIVDKEEFSQWLA